MMVGMNKSFEIEFERTHQDGKTAVLVSSGYGAGWSTWCSDDVLKGGLLFDSRIVGMVLAGHAGLVTEAWLAETWGIDDPDFYVCVLGASDLRVQWVPTGSRFLVDEYDGSEALTLLGDDIGWVA